ncbi:MAG TPA: hypothetical protein VGS58_07475 [Candidatus Sulfopaludibacter sp.]|nr:hypothetical protein [Candidatus Sulfopaludibacter sp.]
MADTQLYLTIGVPVVFNGLLVTLLLAYMNARFAAMEKRFGGRFDSINQRFDDMRDMWRVELRRVGEVIDARLKHLEER